MMNLHDSDYIVGSVTLALAAKATALQPIFSNVASLCAILLAIFGMINYIIKWKKGKN